MVITDIVMPEMVGEEMTQILRADPQFEKLSIIVVSCVVSIREIENLLILGGSRFLPKPVDTADLRHYLQKYLNAEKAA